ncbi:hypothetical protein EGR_04940 [Echinococcus granulosus]|uniref:EGF-like domain-containing protein n=1 Tax=Echinococcus granulosus TaxID=6210 RepID=W6UFM1_ECHGR|nr:hypothetical protein EGR_04940 [Echinococcus granulosus]EUB60230.1 hypothetical protein EGR_04940 [Echinococcus granulosus]
MWPALLAVLISAYAVWCGDSLTLIDECDFIPKLPNSNDWDFVIQNPYKGVVEVLRSPTNKFQVLLNASFEENHDWGLYYTLRTGSNEMFLQLSTRVVQQRVYTDTEEDTVYLQLLLITIASLVLVVFVVSIIFSCWWIKSRQENLEPGLQIFFVLGQQINFHLKHLFSKLVVKEATDRIRPEYAEICRLDGNDTLNADGEIELISLGQNIFNSYENDTVKSKVTGGEYTTFTALAGSKESAEEGREGTMDGAKPSTEANATLPGTTHTLPRYSIAGNNGAGGSGAAVIGVPPSIISSTVASTVNTFGASLPRMSGVEGVGMTGLKLGQSSTTGRTRHMAKEFLDESVLNTAARKLKGSNEQTMRRPPLSNIVSTAGTASTAPQQVILLPAASTGTAGGEQAFLLASTADGIMRPLSPIRVVEAIEPSASVLNPCAIHPAAGTAAATPGATLFVQVDSTQTPVASTELQRLSPSLHTTASGVPILTDEFLAEMAACPQHSYLLRQQMSTTFEASPPIAAVTAAAATPATNIVGVSVDPTADVTYPFEAPPAPALRRRSHDLLESSADKPSASGRDTAVEVVEEASQTPCKPSESTSQRPVSPGYSETLPRTIGRSSSHSNSIESELNKPGSSATLPVGSSSTGARKSALKGARGSKISKQIRFTVLNIVAISCIVTVAMATKTVDNTADGEGGVQVMNVIRFPATSVDANSTESLGGPPGGPQLRITIWIPTYFNLGEAEVKHSMGSDSVSNSTLGRKPPKSIQLWLNRTSRTEVRLGPNVHRSAVEIYGKRETSYYLMAHGVYWHACRLLLASAGLISYIPGNAYVKSFDPIASSKRPRRSLKLNGVMLTQRLRYVTINAADSKFWALRIGTLEAHRNRSLAPIGKEEPVYLNASKLVSPNFLLNGLSTPPDAVDARWIQSTRSCRQRYVCDHSCDPGAGHACICQRGYRPAGPEDRSRLIGYGSGAADGIKGQGRVCLDVDECEDAAVRAECTQRGGVCTNRPGDHQCLCPSGRTCLQEYGFLPVEVLATPRVVGGLVFSRMRSVVPLGILLLAVCASLAVCKPALDARTGESLPTRRHECYLNEQDMGVAKMHIFELIDKVFTAICKCKDRGASLAECELTAFVKVNGTSDGDHSSRSGVGDLKPEIQIIDSRHREYPQPQSETSDAMLQYRTDQPYILRPYPYPSGKSPSHFKSQLQRPDKSPSSSGRIADQPTIHRPVWPSVDSRFVRVMPYQPNLGESNATSSSPKIVAARPTFKFLTLSDFDAHSEESRVESDSTEVLHKEGNDDGHHHHRVAAMHRLVNPTFIKRPISRSRKNSGFIHLNVYLNFVLQRSTLFRLLVQCDEKVLTALSVVKHFQKNMANGEEAKLFPSHPKPLSLESSTKSHVLSHPKRCYNYEDIEAVKLQLYTHINDIIEDIMECIKSGIPIERCKMEGIRRRDGRHHEKLSNGKAVTVDSRCLRGEKDKSNGSSHFVSGGPYSGSSGNGRIGSYTGNEVLNSASYEFGRGGDYPGEDAESGEYNESLPESNSYGERSGYMENDESAFEANGYGGSNSYTGDDLPGVYSGSGSYLESQKPYPGSYSPDGSRGSCGSSECSDFIGTGGYPESNNMNVSLGSRQTLSNKHSVGDKFTTLAQYPILPPLMLSFLSRDVSRLDSEFLPREAP